MNSTANGVLLVLAGISLLHLIRMYRDAEKRVDSALSELERLRAEKIRLLGELSHLQAMMRPAMPPVTPAKVHPTDEQNREHKRRWHERQAMDKALKWDEAAKGPQ